MCGEKWNCSAISERSSGTDFWLPRLFLTFGKHNSRQDVISPLQICVCNRDFTWPNCSGSQGSFSCEELNRKRKGFGSFFQRLWKAMKSPFCCCFHCSSVDVVEPFVLPADLESEIDPAPDHSGVKPYNESFESLYFVGKMIGSGGFGRVFEGTRRFDAKKVAIKRMRKFANFLYLDIPGHPEPLVTEVALLLMMR
ncbi:Serine/threonine-protein kinase pim-2 [Anabarilius grahami]|uniref:non-specific serine/threonine protein kinase n=1 Tax=Anabarilius grahami TaxID=495550 RepID=A0A3N0Y7C8_ANAGA|nr:Serine/threonine-protein kinase pim-2 [Anabarilius grahami]